MRGGSKMCLLLFSNLGFIVFFRVLLGNDSDSLPISAVCVVFVWAIILDALF